MDGKTDLVTVFDINKSNNEPGFAVANPTGDWRDPFTLRVVFLHIPKTGGTTLDSILRQSFAEYEICSERFGAIGLWPEDILRSYRYFSMHSSREGLRHIPGPYQIVTLLRDPISRLISQYTYYRSFTWERIWKGNIHLPRVAKYFNLSDFLNWESKDFVRSIDNTMTRYLTDHVRNQAGVPWRDDKELLDAALKALSDIDCFGITEYMEESTSIICKHLNIRCPAFVPMLNGTHDLSSTKVGEHDSVEPLEMSDEIEEKLYHLNRLDLVLYQEAKKRFVSLIGHHSRRIVGFSTQCGQQWDGYDRSVMVAKSSEAGFLLYGPYIRLNAGTYRITLEIMFPDISANIAASTLLAKLDVVSNFGTYVHYSQPIVRESVVKLTFMVHTFEVTLKRITLDVEIRLYTYGLCAVVVDRCASLETAS